MEHGENDSRSWAQVLTFLRRMKQLGRAVILLHHDNKQGGARGFSGGLTTLDATLHLTKVPRAAGNEANFRISMGKNRFGSKFLPVVTRLTTKNRKPKWIFGKVAVGKSKPPSASKKTNEETLKEIHAHRDRGDSLREIEEKMKISKSKIQRLLKE